MSRKCGRKEVCSPNDFVMVPLKRELANKICDIAELAKTDPTTVLNSGVHLLTNAYFDAERNGEFEEDCKVDNLPVCCDHGDLTEVAEELSDADAKEMLLEQLKEVIRTAHSVEISITMNE